MYNPSHHSDLTYEKVLCIGFSLLGSYMNGVGGAHWPSDHAGSAEALCGRETPASC
jgi:hypothetical protein